MEQIIKQLGLMLTANYPLISLVTSEYNRTMQYVRYISQEKKYKFFQWDCEKGLQQHNYKNGKWEIPTPIPDHTDSLGLLRGLLYESKENEKCVYFIEDFHRYFDNIQIITCLRKLAENWRFEDKHLILCGTAAQLPNELEKFVTIIDFPLPNTHDLGKLLARVAGGKEISEDLEKYLIDAALGLTAMEADAAFRLAYQKNGLKNMEAVQIVAAEKEQIIKKSGILDYYPINENLSDVGGLENLKKWLQQRKKAFEPKAKTFGLKEPKGLLLVGVPGCGKSLAAKATAAEWKMPLLKLDIGKVFDGLVGASESNLRNAIKTAEAASPCVLWIDEIEKGLSTGGEQDGGTSARVFATILNWMQEKTKPVFVFATANNLDALPPELLRKGRFDEIFFVDLPTAKERENIFKIHLQRRKQTKIDNWEELGKQTVGFNGAEIEEVVNEAMFIAYNENQQVEHLQWKHLDQAIKQIVPLSFTMGNKIRKLREFGRSRRARPAGVEGNEENIFDKNCNSTFQTDRERKYDADADNLFGKE